MVITTYTLVFMLAFYALVFFRTRKDASIFTSSIVSAYVVFLSWSAMASSPEEECNPFVNDSGNLTSQIIIGGIFTFVCLLGISMMSTGGHQYRQAAIREGDSKQIGENAKNVIAEDEEESKPQNLDNTSVNG